MKYILAVLLAGLAGGVSASDLPDCVGDDYPSWNNCVGTYTYANGNKYVGEWKYGEEVIAVPEETGPYAGFDRVVEVGEPNGPGTMTYADGSTEEGFWVNGELVGTVAEVEAAEQARVAAEKKAERIYNACLVDKGADVGIHLVGAVEATCRSIAEDPSFLEDWRYD